MVGSRLGMRQYALKVCTSSKTVICCCCYLASPVRCPLACCSLAAALVSY